MTGDPGAARSKRRQYIHGVTIFIFCKCRNGVYSKVGGWPHHVELTVYKWHHVIYIILLLIVSYLSATFRSICVKVYFFKITLILQKHPIYIITYYNLTFDFVFRNQTSLKVPSDEV